MDMIPVWVAGVACLIYAILGVCAARSSYRLGVNDGYMYSKDPSCPGYRKAERILRSYGKI